MTYINKIDETTDFSQQVLLCGAECPDGYEPHIAFGPKTLSEALAQYAVCDSNMEHSGYNYIYIIDLTGKILISKMI